MGTFEDITGKIFYNIQADEYLGNSEWRCHCLQCNTKFIKRAYQLKNYGCSYCMKEHLDESYFSKIDTPNKAYVLGFLWADGCHYCNQKKIKIDLQEEDVHILNDIKSDMKWTGKVSSYIAKKGHSYRKNEAIVYRLAITNPYMSKDLENIGFVSHREKSHIPFEHIPDEYIKDFIRGYFDGNGCVSFNSSFKNLTVTICGGTNIVHDIGDVLTKLGMRVVYHRRRPNNLDNDTLAITRTNDKIQFLCWIYSNCELKLNRKYNKYQKYLCHKLNQQQQQ